MKTHRYRYLYLPVSRYISRLSPQTQVLLVVGKLALIVLLFSFDVAYANNLI